MEGNSSVTEIGESNKCNQIIKKVAHFLKKVAQYFKSCPKRRKAVLTYVVM